MAELADAHDSKSCGAIRAGSSPATGMKKTLYLEISRSSFFYAALRILRVVGSLASMYKLPAPTALAPSL